MKNCVIVHGCPDSPEHDPKTRTYDRHWITVTQKTLNDRGIATDVPLMPEPWQPNYEAYKARFAECHVDEDTVLIGHSCGSAFLVRWLGDTKQRVAKLILVAPWKIAPQDDEGRKAYYEYPIDGSIRGRVGKIVIFTSNNEEDDGKRSAQMYHEALGGEVISLPNHGHYTEGDMGTGEFPELLEVVLGDRV